MAYNSGNSGSEDASGNIWSSGSHGGARMGYSSSNNDDDNGSRGGGSYRGSFGNNNSRSGGSSGGGYGFRRQNNDRGDVETLTDAIFIQNLPKSITRDQILDIFSTVGTIKTDERSGGPKIWIYKDRDTGESNGRATVTYEDDETANRAISKYNDQEIDSIGSIVRVQLAQRRNRNNNGNDRGGSRGGYRGARSNWSSDSDSRQNYNSSSSSRWGSSSGKGFSDDRSGGSSSRGGGFRGMGGGSSSFENGDDRSGSYRGSRSGPYRGASRGNGGSSNYAPY
ncbi:unnamed protein product [Rotaria magnacalcarata]|uniref:RRM domain-containing protein n=2 Tax=Rotaria magnacalcarata TaxID=392030 RepID=A0A816THM4_9BILA|nr:unnamed protein product [Rotaria magnacalcarata]